MSINHLPKTDKIRIGTRKSPLALAQAQEVKSLILENSDIEPNQIEIVKITTSGDKIQNQSLAEIGGKGLFIKELEESLVSEKIDIAVHSAKDVPPELRNGTEISAFTKRSDVNDYFISNKYKSIKELPKNAVIGTSSSRRKAVLLGIRDDLEVVNFRGNIETRLKKIEKNQVDATILALCGLKRIGKEIDKSRIISISTMLPAVGQGGLALQTRKSDKRSCKVARKINHQPSEICISGERLFLQKLNASCKSPIAVYCQIIAKKLRFRAIIFDFDGKTTYKIDLSDEVVNLKTSHDLARKAAQDVVENASELLAKICA